MNNMNFRNMHTEELIDELNILLSNYHIYYQRLRNFHWNIQGENFFELHEHFEKLYKDAQSKIDTLAERIQTLDHFPLSLLREYLETAELEEINTRFTDREMVYQV